MPRSKRQSLAAGTPRTVRRHWREADADAVLKRLESSGLSVGQFAAREDLNAPRLYRWRARLRLARPPRQAFVEIKPTTTVIELVLRSGDVVRLPAGFSEDSLRRLVEVLDGRAARC
jgi:hypothetical protein